MAGRLLAIIGDERTEQGRRCTADPKARFFEKNKVGLGMARHVQGLGGSWRDPYMAFIHDELVPPPPPESIGTDFEESATDAAVLQSVVKVNVARRRPLSRSVW